MASPTSTWINNVTAVSSTVVATLLIGFLGTFKDMATQAPMIQEHMRTTTEKLVQFDRKQSEQSLMLASLMKDYASRDELRVELGKLEVRIQQIEMQQALLRQKQDATRR